MKINWRKGKSENVNNHRKSVGLVALLSTSHWQRKVAHSRVLWHILRHKVVHNFTVKLITVKLYISLGRQMCISGIAMGYKKFSRLTNITFNQVQYHGGAHEQILKSYFAQGCLDWKLCCSNGKLKYFKVFKIFEGDFGTRQKVVRQW